MRQTLYEYLLARPSGASPRELLDLVFTYPGADAEFGPRFLKTLLGTDGRFVWQEADGRWTLRAHTALAASLTATTFVVVDLETTGGASGAGAIIEIGAVRIRGGQVLGEFQQLVHPGVRLPPFITQLTGITDHLLAEQPRIAAVWPRFVEFLGDAVIVAHNARFDLGFLNAAALALAGTPLPHAHLCTLRLARRLLPAVRRRGLDALAAHFGVTVADRHRALGDARITVDVLFHLLELLAVRGIVRLDQALDVQHQARDGRRFVCPLPRAAVAELPAAPGVYRLFDADGRLLYVGKARNLRERVGSYLSNAAGHSNKTLDLIRHSHAVRVQVTGSELEAALEEAAAIRRERPPYNRLGKHLPRIAFLKLTACDRYPRLAVTRTLGAARGRFFGPFRSRDEAERMLGLLARLFRLRTCGGRLRPNAAASPCVQGQIDACTAPCAGRVDAAAYRDQVKACLRLLDGDGTEAEEALLRRREVHASAQRFEAGARAQRDLDLLHRLLRRQHTLGWITERRSFLILQPSQDGALVLVYAVLGGRLALRLRVYDPEGVEDLLTRLGALRAAMQPPLTPHDVDGTTILAAWLRDRGEAVGCVFSIPEEGELPAALLEEWRAACRALLRPVAANGGEPPAPPEEQHRDGDQQPGAAVGAAAD